MIYKRAIAKLRAQDWTAISIELLIVVVGVFIGLWVADWNQQREAQRDVLKLIARVEPQIALLRRSNVGAHDYYAVTERYAETALKGWANDPSVDDADFVTAAYQASQIVGYNMNGDALTTTIGAATIPKIEDADLQQALGQLFSLNFDTLTYDRMYTDYRKQVREVIPHDIQRAIRDHCGDQRIRPGEVAIRLPATCHIEIPTDTMRSTALALRAHPELAGLLDYHLSQVAAYLFVVDTMDEQLAATETAIKRTLAE